MHLFQGKLRIIVTGYLAQYPLGGVAWDYIQYVAGLARMGHDVYYIEDTGLWPFSPETGGVAKTCDANVAYLNRLMAHFGLGDRWAYRFPWESQWYGLSTETREEVVRTADCLINVSGALANPAEYRHVSRLVYIDSDPVFTQVKLAKGQSNFQHAVDCHDIHFSFGERHSPQVPVTGHTWHPTRQPVLLEEWATAGAPRDVFTTIMNWTSYKDLVYEGQMYGQKDREFRAFMQLPSHASSETFEIAVNTGKTRRTPHQKLRWHGWKVVDPNDACPDLASYRQYIQQSKAEWSVAKHGYVVGQSGWFSCRSACYLAAGRPVVVQDTGFSEILPTGNGILAFRDLDEALQGIEEVAANYQQHSQAALEVAREYFAAEIVLGNLLETAMTGSPKGTAGTSR